MARHHLRTGNPGDERELSHRHPWLQHSAHRAARVGDLDYAFEYESVIQQHSCAAGAAKHAEPGGRTQAEPMPRCRQSWISSACHGQAGSRGAYRLRHHHPHQRPHPRRRSCSSPSCWGRRDGRSWRRTTIRSSIPPRPTPTTPCPPACKH